MAIEYKVQKGDTLSAIGRKYGVSYQEIAKANGISNPDLIYAGSTLVIPGQKTEPAKPTTPAASKPAAAPAAAAKPATQPAAKPAAQPAAQPAAKPAATPAAQPAQTPASQPVTTQGGFTYNDFSYESYAPSSTVQQANNLLNQHKANKPGSYTPVWQDEADSYLAKYQNRDPFSYNFNTDALYNQYKDMYIQQGQLAMMDTMGQAAAMTGGYGNSYAATAGQQAYNNQLGRLNDVIPELWQRAYDRYDREGQELLDMYGMYMDKEALEYSRYQDSLDDWYREASRLQDNYDTLSAQDYDMYLDRKNTAYDEYLTDRSEAENAWLKQIDLEYKQSRDQVEDERYASETAYEKGMNKIDMGVMPNADELKALGMTSSEAKAYIDDQKAAAASKASSGSNSSGGNNVEYQKVTTETDAYWVKEFQKAAEQGTVDLVAQRMEAEEYNPDYIDTLYRQYGGNGNPIDTGVAPITGPGEIDEIDDSSDDPFEREKEKRYNEKMGRYTK